MIFLPAKLKSNFALLVLMLFSALGVAAFASTYLIFNPDDFSFASQRTTYSENLGLIKTHVFFGIIALVIGPLQFFKNLRNHRNFHRITGFVYLASIAASAFAGFNVATFAHGGLPNTVAFWFLDFFWIVTTALAWLSIRGGDIRAHQRWMMRSYAVTFSAVTLRAELGMLIGVFGLDFDQAYAIVPWTCWVLNLLVVEWLVLPQVGKASFSIGGTSRSAPPKHPD